MNNFCVKTAASCHQPSEKQPSEKPASEEEIVLLTDAMWVVVGVQAPVGIPMLAKMKSLETAPAIQKLLVPLAAA